MRLRVSVQQDGGEAIFQFPDKSQSVVGKAAVLTRSFGSGVVARVAGRGAGVVAPRSGHIGGGSTSNSAKLVS